MPGRAELALCLALLPGAAVAQARDAGVLQLFQGGAEVGRESFRRSPLRSEQVATIPLLNLRVSGVAERATGGAFAGYRLTVSNAAGDSSRGGYRIAPAGDSVHITGQLGTSQVDRMRGADFDLVLPPQSLASFVELVALAAGRDTTLRLLVVGPDSVMPAVIRFSADSFRIRFAGLEMPGTLRDGHVVTIDVPVQRVRVIRAAAPDSLPPMAGLRRPKPDYSAPAGAPYRATEVRVPAGAGADTFSLGCTFTLPSSGTAPFPGVVTITGSGSQPRDGELWPLLPTYRLFGQIADRLGHEGIAVLRCDDRGAGSSTGHAENATSADLAGDTRAQVAWLRSRPEIDGDRIALVGHSEGGLIGPLLAAQDRRIAALVVMAGPAKPGVDILVDQVRWPLEEAQGLSARDRQEQLAAAEARVRGDSMPANLWLRWFLHYDPLRAARLVRQPTLILQGALDRQVSPGQADSLAAAMRQAGNADVTVRVFQRLNHLFLVAETDGSPGEYATLREVRVPTEVLDDIGTWLSRRLNSKH